jgi:hypothetical protein
MLKFRNSLVVDAEIGFDGEDSQNSRLTGDRGIYISNDGERHTAELFNVTHKKHQLCLLPSKLDDSLAEWIPVYEEETEPDEEARAVLAAVSSRKRKHYDSSVSYILFLQLRMVIYINSLFLQDNQIREWRREQQLFADEAMCRHGLGDWTASQECGLCQSDVSTTRFFKCGACREFLQCEACCLQRHELTPLHFPKVRG